MEIKIGVQETAREVQLDSGGSSPDAAYLADWVRHSLPRSPAGGYYYSNNSEANTVYLLLSPSSNTPPGYWLLRMDRELLQSLIPRAVT